MSGKAAALGCKLNGWFPRRIQARFRSKGGVFGPIRTLSTAGQNASDVRIAMTADGDAVITWQQFDGTNWRAMGATTP